MSVGHLDFRGNCFAENFWGGRPQCCQHVFRIGSSERKHRMHFDDFWSLEAPGVAILLGFDFMVIFNAFKTKVQDRTRPRSQDFWQKMENGLNVFFFERLVSFYHYFHIFPGSKYFAKLPSKKSTQYAPQVSHTSPENWWFPSSVHLLYLWGAVKLQRCTYWPLQPTQVPSFIDNLTSLEGCIPWVVPSPRWWSTFMLATCFFVLFFLVWNFSKGPKGYEFESNRYSRPWGVWCCMLLFKTEKLPGANRSKHIWYLNHQYIQVEE